MNYKGFDINTSSTPKPWGAREEQAIKDIIDNIVGSGVSQTGGHRHDTLYTQDKTTPIVDDSANTGMVVLPRGKGLSIKADGAALATKFNVNVNGELEAIDGTGTVLKAGTLTSEGGRGLGLQGNILFLDTSGKKLLRSSGTEMYIENTDVNGNININSARALIFDVTTDINMNADTDIVLNATDDITMNAGDNFTVNATDDLTLNASENLSLNATLALYINALVNIETEAPGYTHRFGNSGIVYERSVTGETLFTIDTNSTSSIIYNDINTHTLALYRSETDVEGLLIDIDSNKNAKIQLTTAKRLHIGMDAGDDPVCTFDFQNSQTTFNQYTGSDTVMLIDDTKVQVGNNKSLDTKNGYFLPRRTTDGAQPTPNSGELRIWRDSDDGKVYLIYNDASSGVKKVEMV